MAAVDCIGESLCFEADTRIFLIAYTAFTGEAAVKVVPRIYLNPRLVCICLLYTSGLRTLNHGFNHIDISGVKREYTCIVLFSHCQQFFYFYVRHSIPLLHLFHGLDAVMCDRAQILTGFL